MSTPVRTDHAQRSDALTEQDARVEAGNPLPEGAPRARYFRWGFFSASGMILALMLVGHAFWTVLDDFNSEGFGVREWLFVAFCASTATLVFLMRAAVRRFFLDVHAGVSLISVGTLAVCVGVLVPQIDGFEDPEQRITPENYEQQYEQFRWAEGYFIYHMLHAVPFYGRGMPETEIPEPVLARLDDYGRRYGREEEKNTTIRMEAAYSSGPKQRGIHALITKHDDTLRKAFNVATALDLNRAYKSYWFRTLGFLLGFAMFLNLTKFNPRKLFTVQKAGFAVTHVGMLLTLVGVWVSAENTDRGILHLDLREGPKREYWRYHDPNKIARLPFWVRLDRFARQDWKTLEVGFLDDNSNTRPPSYTLWPGREIDLDWTDGSAGEPQRPRIRLRVKELAEHAHVGVPILREANEVETGFGPLVELSAPDFERILGLIRRGVEPSVGSNVRRTEYLSPDIPGKQMHWDAIWEFRMKGLHMDDAERAKLDPRTLFPAEADERLGTLSVRRLGAGDVVARRIPITSLGQRIDAPGGVSIRITEATANYSADPNTLAEVRDSRPLAQQPPVYPGVWVEIEDTEGREERRLVLERVQAAEHGKQEKYEFDDLVLELEWERWTSPGPPRFALVWGGVGAPTLISEEEGTVTEVELGRALPLGERSNVLLVRALENGTFEPNLTFDENVTIDGFDKSFYSQDPKGLVLDVLSDPETPEEQVREVRMATTSASLADLWRDPENRFYLRYFENSAVMPYEWRSVLSIYEKHPENRVRIFSGATGEPIEDLQEGLRAQVLAFYDSVKERPDISGGIVALRDLNGDEQNDFVGPVQRVDVGDDRDREIRVNDYFKYKGYRFFQTNAIPEIPTYSGVGVVFDPGIITVLSGMYTIIAGTILAFIVRPLVENSRRRRKQTPRA